MQRLADKRHAWERDGMDCLIPNSIAQSLLGYRFICPDMIGDGEFQSFLDGAMIDEELFVRYYRESGLALTVTLTQAVKMSRSKRLLTVCRIFTKSNRKG